ncbi:MAG: hypothetical protein WCK10_04235, partial [Candidatus Staskawiczbacteria bacterium]
MAMSVNKKRALVGTGIAAGLTGAGFLAHHLLNKSDEPYKIKPTYPPDYTPDLDRSRGSGRIRDIEYLNKEHPHYDKMKEFLNDVPKEDTRNLRVKTFLGPDKNNPNMKAHFMRPNTLIDGDDPRSPNEISI